MNPSQTQKVVRVEDLRKSYGHAQALRGLSFEVAAGEVFTIVGPNGSGKTTTVEILEGLRRHDGGSFEILDGLPTDLRVKQAIGVLLQDSQPMDNLTPLEMLRLHRSFYATGLDPEDALERVGLMDSRGVIIRKLSGGQRRRLGIALAVINDPLLVFLDEPTTGLDPGARRRVWAFVEGLRTRGRSVVLTTHYMDEAERLSDRVAVLADGRILACGSPADLIGGSGVGHSIHLGLRMTPGAARELLQGTFPTARFDENGTVLTTHDLEADLPRLCGVLKEHGQQMDALHVHRPSLDDVFHQLTDVETRDG